MIVSFGLSKVDERGLEAYSGVNQFSAPMSLRSGFMIARWMGVDFVWGKTSDVDGEHVPSKEVRRIEMALQAHPIVAVWRPVGEKYAEGETVLP